MDIKIFERFSEELLVSANVPVIFKNIFEDYPNLRAIDAEKYLQTVRNIDITLTELDLPTLSRKKIKVNAFQAINSIKNNSAPDKRFSISNINDKYFSEELRSLIPIFKMLLTKYVVWSKKLHYSLAF